MTSAVISAAIYAGFGALLGAQEVPRYAGVTEKGFLLPNGSTLTPAGDHVLLTDLPLNIIPLADSRFALAATSGYNAHELSLIDVKERKVVDHQTVSQSWFGLALSAAGDRVWWSAGGGNELHVFRLADRRLSPLPGPERGTAATIKTGTRTSRFGSGLAVDPARKLLYVLDVDRGTIAAMSIETQKELKSAAVGARPYDVVVGSGGRLLFVSDWAGRSVRVIDPADLRTTARIAVGEHPSQITVHPLDDRIFVACASSNCVSVIDTRRGVVTETINTALFPMAPEGSTPDALAIAPDGKTLFVANADNNNVAVIDISTPNRSQMKGFIPTNHHKLAEEFVLLDNLYCNGHVSADGHPWSTMAYNTDYIARNWALTYSSRAGIHDDDDGDLTNAPSGYLWDACARAGLSYRSYGE
jgi:YVTN family beta-propeller protein